MKQALAGSIQENKSRVIIDKCQGNNKCKQHLDETGIDMQRVEQEFLAGKNKQVHQRLVLDGKKRDSGNNYPHRRKNQRTSGNNRHNQEDFQQIPFNPGVLIGDQQG